MVWNQIGVKCYRTKTARNEHKAHPEISTDETRMGTSWSEPLPEVWGETLLSDVQNFGVKPSRLFVVTHNVDL